MSSTQHTAHSTQGFARDPVSFFALCSLLSAVCCLFTGCVHRQLTIRSEPPGAQLIVNDKRLGTTPHSYDFEWYGWYRITLLKEGYDRLDDHVRLNAPFYLWIPLDLAMELWPFPVRDTHALSYTLTPSQALPEPSAPALETPPPSAPQQPDTPEPSDGHTG